MQRLKPAFYYLMLFLTCLVLGGCAGTITSEEITADFLIALVASWGVVGIVLSILGLVLAILWMLMPFFVWRIARHSKKTAARSLQISRSLELLDGTSARIENSIRQAAATGSAENRRQS